MKKEKKKKPLKQAKIGMRICRDIVLGVVGSLLICFTLSAVYEWLGAKLIASGISLPDFNYNDLFFTELSIAFLVISFVTLLANKTEDVYWVDVIQYRLVKPDFTSIVDIASFIFANMIISLFAYLFPTKTELLLFSFVQIIFLLGLLSLKLLMAFFGIEDLKRELEQEYEQALDFKKTVVMAYNHRSHSYRMLPLSTQIKFWFDKDTYNEYSYKAPTDFKDTEYSKDRSGSIEEMYTQVVYGQNRHKISSLYMLKLRVKLFKYSIKFGGNVNANIDMMDKLYSNTLNAIEQNQIQKACEQICFMFKYEEIQRAFSCMRYALEKCPMIFVKEFQYLRDKKIWKRNYAPMFNMLVLELHKLPEYTFYSNSAVVTPLFLYMSDCAAFSVKTESLMRQFEQTLNEDDYLGICSIFRTLAKTNRYGVMDDFFYEWLDEADMWEYEDDLQNRSYIRNKLPSKVLISLNEFYRKNINRFAQGEDKYIAHMFDQAFSSSNYNAVIALLKAYYEWLEECLNGVYDDVCICYLDQDHRKKLYSFLVTPCDIFRVYSILEKKYRKNEMSDDIFFVCLNTIGRCYVVLGKWWARKEIDDMIKGIESHIIKPCASVIRDKKVDIDDWLDVDKEYDFWRKVMGES